MSQNIARIGIGVFILKNGKFLMGRRQGSHGNDSWSIPGGHLEFGESFEETALREVLEETGLRIKNIRFGAVTNDYFKRENKHYVTIWMLSDWESGDEQLNEPDKFVEMQWRDFGTLPKPLFLPWEQLLISQFIDNIKKELTHSIKFD